MFLKMFMLHVNVDAVGVIFYFGVDVHIDVDVENQICPGGRQGHVDVDDDVDINQRGIMLNYKY